MTIAEEEEIQMLEEQNKELLRGSKAGRTAMASMKKIILEQKEENEKLKNNVLILVDLSEELKKSMDKDGENLKKFQGFYDIKKKKLSKSQKKCFNLEKEIKDLKRLVTILNERLSLRQDPLSEKLETLLRSAGS